MKLLFPRAGGSAMTGVLLNTAGGITGGDRFDVSATVRQECHLILTSQAAERAYRAQPGETGHLSTQLTVEGAARLDWLPQETLLYDQSALKRSLTIDMAGNSRVLICEPVVFGRTAMGEHVRHGLFHDRIDLRRDGTLIFADRTRLEGSMAEILSGPATAGGCAAMASVLLAATDAERFLDPARALLPDTAGAGLIRPGLLFARLLARDAYELRQTLQPLVRLLSGNQLPRTWMI